MRHRASWTSGATPRHRRAVNSPEIDRLRTSRGSCRPTPCRRRPAALHSPPHRHCRELRLAIAGSSACRPPAPRTIERCSRAGNLAEAALDADVISDHALVRCSNVPFDHRRVVAGPIGRERVRHAGKRLLQKGGGAADAGDPGEDLGIAATPHTTLVSDWRWERSPPCAALSHAVNSSRARWAYGERIALAPRPRIRSVLLLA
jgi:hypothetical protein